MSNYSGVQTGRMGNLFTGALVAPGADHTIYVVLDSGILLTVVNTRLTNEFNRAVEVGYDLDTDPALLQVLEYSAIATTGGGHLIQDEGTSLTQRSNLNFIGEGVTAEDDGTSDTTRITIPGNSFAFPASDNNYYVAYNNSWATIPLLGIREAPTDDGKYVRRNGAWEALPAFEPQRRYELLMQDGVSSPPIPLETEDGSDWLYQD